jgi:V8-like Glu-specific endopeptidase
MRIRTAYEAEPEFEEAQEFFEELEEEVVGKRDSRRPVRNTLEAPYRWICALDVERDLPGRGIVWSRATGTLISPRHVLAAGHTLLATYGTSRIKARRIVVTPARDRTTPRDAPFGFRTAEKLFFPMEWESREPNEQYGDPEFDFGLIQLPAKDLLSEAKHGKLKNQPLGFWGHTERGEGTVLEIVPPKSLKGKRVFMSGYPLDKCEFLQAKKDAKGRLLKEDDQPKAVQQCLAKSPSPLVVGASYATAQFEADGKFLDVESLPDSANTLMHSIDTHGGQSGSPLWIQEGRTRKLVGIHTLTTYVEKSGKKNGYEPVNQCVRISSNVRRYLAEWMR